MIIGPVILALYLRMKWMWTRHPKSAYQHVAAKPSHFVQHNDDESWYCLNCPKSGQGF